MGKACSTIAREEECMWDIGGKDIRKGITRKSKT
jgi:hypothetical protein